MSVRKSFRYSQKDYDENSWNFVKAKLYPSTEVKGAYSKRYKHSSQFTPDELKRLARTHNALPENKKPFIMSEHSENPSDRIGRVTNLYFADSDGWLWADGTIFPEKKDEVRRLMRESDGGLAGVSLCYAVSDSSKKMVEFSIVKNPDFAGAQIICCHSAEDQQEAYVLWPNTRPPILPSLINKMSGEESTISERLVRLRNGSYVVCNDSDVAEARDYLQTQGFEDPVIIVENPDDYDPTVLAASMAEARIAHSSAAEENEARELNEELNRTRHIAGIVGGIIPEGASSTLVEKIGTTMMSNGPARAVAEIALTRLNEEKARSDALSTQLKKQQAQLNAQSERLKMLGGGDPKQRRLHSHSSSSPGVVNFMDIFNALHNKKSSSSPSSSSSSSSSSTPRRVEHSAPSSRKREERPLTTDTDADDSKVDLHEAFSWAGMSLYPDPHAPKPGDSIVSHSSTGSQCVRFPEGTQTRTAPLQISSGILRGICDGKRDIGTGFNSDLLQNSMANHHPKWFTALMYAVGEYPPEVNQDLGVCGWDDKHKPNRHSGQLYVPTVTRDSRATERRIDVDSAVDWQKIGPTTRFFDQKV